MKKLIAAAFTMIIVGAFTTNLKAQTLGAQSDVDVTARILKQIVLTATDVSFGAVPAGNIATLSPSGSVRTNVSASATVGRLLISATANEPIRVEFPGWVTMSGVAPLTAADSITFIPSISVASGSNAIGSAEQGTSILLAHTVPGSVPSAGTDAGGTGIGQAFGGAVRQFGIVYTSPTVGPNLDFVSLFIGGSLYGAGTSGAGIIPTSQPTGTYTGTLDFNVVYNN